MSILGFETSLLGNKKTPPQYFELCIHLCKYKSHFNMKIITTLLFISLFFVPNSSYAQQKLRVLVLTDIENEPDDAMSMVRFMTYCNQWDVEGLLATTSTHQRDKTAAWRIRQIVRAYGQVRDNLLLHEKGYPDTTYLLRVIKEGLPKYGMTAVGQGMDSDGSDWIIKVVDKNDNRPVWIPVWGGANCLAQALWKVKQTRSPEELEKFVAKIRIYTISDQDDTGPWIRKTFPNLFYIVSPGYAERGAYHYATWSGISGDNLSKIGGANFTIVDNPWLDDNIRKNHGPLGAQHPHTEYIMEGDTPSFFNLIDNGLSNPEHPNWGGWGGRYELYTPRTRKWFYEPETRPIWTDAEDEVIGNDNKIYNANKATIWRWREAYQYDFAARMDWCIKSYKEANHPPVVALGHAANLSVVSGDSIPLSAEGTKDPDGNALTYQWIYYREVGTFESGRPLQIKNNTEKNAYLTAPEVTSPETIHIILTVTDNGIPALTRYQRVILTVFPKIKSQVFSWENIPIQNLDTKLRRKIAEGSSTFAKRFSAHATTIEAGKAPNAPHPNKDVDELIIVKEGQLKITINDKSKVIDAGGIALVMAGDVNGIQNVGTTPATYYVLQYQSKIATNKEQGNKAGGSLLLTQAECEFKAHDKGGRRDYYNRATSQFKIFEMHTTALNAGKESHAPHTHTTEEIILLTKGTAHMHIAGKLHPVKAGDLVFLDSNVPHALINSGTEQCEYFAFTWRN
jgi:quercetin dioxygenase-like cupin family protein